jgi:hypothetical protein
MAGRVLGRLSYIVDAENNVSRGLAEASGEIKAWERGVDATQARIEVEADLKGLEKDLAEAKALAKAMGHEKIEIEMEVKGFEKAMAEEKALSKSRRKNYKDNLKELEGLNHALEQNRSNMAAIGEHQIVRKQDLSNIKAAERAISSERSELAKLGEEYARLYTKRQKIDKLDRGTTARERILGNRVKAEMETVGRAIERAGGNTRDFQVDLDKNNHSLRSWMSTIGETRLHLGFFSTTVKSAGIILTTLGPVILSVIGAAGAAIGTLGAGIAGLGAVAAAGFGGFALSAIGAGIALRQPIHQLGVAWKASKAYSDAVQKYGKDSSQASDKQAQLANSLKGLPPAAQKAVQSLGDMRTQFMKLGGTGIRKDFFNSFAQGIQTAKALLPTFATESRKTFHAASQGVNQWFQALRSPEGKQAIADIMGNFRKSVPAIMDGLGALGATLGHIMQSASTFLPQLTRGFDTWAHSIEASVGSGDQLTSRIGRLVTSMQQVGHFAQAAGAGLTTLFSIASGPGGGLFDSMTRSLQRWNAEMKRDPKGTHDFFQQSVDTFRQLGPAVARILMSLGNLAEAFAPATEFVAGAINTLTKALTAFSQIPLGKQVIQVAALAYALNKISTAIALSGLLGGAAAARAGAAGGLLGTLFGRGGAKGVAQGASQAAVGLGEVETAAVGASGALVGTEAAAVGAEEGAVGLGAILAPEVVIPLVAVGAAAFALSKILGSGGGQFDAWNSAFKAFGSSTAAIPADIQAVTTAQQKANDAWRTANELFKQGKTSSKQFIQSVREGAKADNQAAEATSKRNFDLNKAKTSVSDLNAEYHKQVGVLRGIDPAYRRADFERQAGIVTALATSVRLATLNYNRMKQGVDAVGPGMLRSLNAIKQIAGRGTALKFRFSDQNVTRSIAGISGKLKGLGRQQQVINILANSKSAEQALGALRRLVNQVTGGKHKVDVEANDKASAKVQRIQQRIAGLRAKIVNLSANDKAGPVVDALKAKIAALHDKTVTLTEIHRIQEIRSHTNIGGPGGGGYAGGVKPPGFAVGGWLDRAYARAERRMGLRPESGARVDSPRYIVGEQNNATEYIITDSAAYRSSNLRYLDQAAKALGQSVVPGFKKGGSNDNKTARKQTSAANKALKGGTGDRATADRWQADIDKQQYWADEYDLDRRSYDSGVGTGGIYPGFDIGALNFDLQNQIDAYQDQLNILGAVRKLNSIPDVQVPSGKMKGKVKKNVNAAAKRVSDYNEAVDSARSDAKGTTEGGLNHLIQALKLDQLELSASANTNTVLGNESANAARQSLYSQFASNVIGGVSAPTLGAFGLSSASTIPALTSGGPAPSLASVFATPPLAPNPSSGGSSSHASSVDGGVTINQTFAAPPPDPHTWTRTVAFEIGAASA